MHERFQERFASSSLKFYCPVLTLFSSAKKISLSPLSLSLSLYIYIYIMSHLEEIFCPNHSRIWAHSFTDLRSSVIFISWPLTKHGTMRIWERARQRPLYVVLVF
eukprot:TRINITY_DN16091_c3_g1_i1.p1 TRINITY_DN16091_c3_g1~~TRINITY_DN16091_c3_g1_i1.p1  ORF type:complete len:105 (-),score=9.40 TRINITY_DN16091_c3_g1_i1:158-472(-)